MAKKDKYIVRFNLGAGENFMKWKIQKGNVSDYYEPSEVLIIMEGCKLVNQQGTAQKIFDGANKTVCAWVECDNVRVIPKAVTSNESSDKVSYNPRVTPHWTLNGEIVDKQEFQWLFTAGREVRVAK